MHCAGVGGWREWVSDIVSTAVGPFASEGEVRETAGSSQCGWISSVKADVPTSSRERGLRLPLFDGDQSVGVPCRCKDARDSVRHGDV